MSDDRFTGRPRTGGERGNFGGPGADRGGFNGPAGPSGDRGFGGSGGDRGGFDRPRFPRPVGVGGALAGPGPLHSMRLREGDREIEVSGSAAFVRQVIDDLPALLARLRGETPPRPTSISMPTVAPTATLPVQGTPVPATPVRVQAPPSRNPSKDNGTAHASGGGLEQAILEVLRQDRYPLAVAAIRKRIGGDVTAQQVRRTLERSSAVTGSDDRPTTYRLR